MNLTQQVINEIKKSQGATIPTIVKDLIASNSTKKTHMKTLWNEYMGYVPILSDTKIDNPARWDERINHDFHTTIVNQAVGYFTGIPVEISIPEKATNNYTEAENLLSDFLQKNNYDKLDAELETYASVCGKAYRLLFYQDVFDYQGKSSIKVVMKNILPWEAIVVNDSSIQEPAYGLIYYPIELQNGNNTVTRIKAEFYDAVNVYYLIEDGNGNYVPDDSYGEYQQKHGFNYMPLVEYSNNTLQMGDFEKVRKLINGYDRAVSGFLSDHLAFSLAFLIFYGIEPTEEEIIRSRKTGAFYVPLDNTAGSDNSRIEFLTKNLNTSNVDALLNRLNRDIFRFSQCVDFSDETGFSGAQSGEARKFKLVPLETKVKEKERWFKFAYQYLFKVVTTFWSSVKGVEIDYEDIEYTFTRNLPADVTINDIISLQQAGIISTETAISNLTFIDDTSAELEKVETEKETTGNLFNLDNLSMNSVTGSAA